MFNNLDNIETREEKVERCVRQTLKTLGVGAVCTAEEFKHQLDNYLEFSSLNKSENVNISVADNDSMYISFKIGNIHYMVESMLESSNIAVYHRENKLSQSIKVRG